VPDQQLHGSEFARPSIERHSLRRAEGVKLEQSPG
jgi:hypothetical protein